MHTKQTVFQFMLNSMRTIVVVGIVFMMLTGCSTRKDRFINRAYHQTTTKYNVLFNGNEALDQAVKAQAEAHQPNFWERLPIEPFPLPDIYDTDAPPNPNYTLAETKAVAAVQKHSMLIDGTQRNKQIDESYMLLGKARFYNGRYLQAIEAFNYIIDQLTNSSSIHTAQLWRAKSYLQLKQETRAANELTNLINVGSLSTEEQAVASANQVTAFLALDSLQKATTPLQKAIFLEKNKNLVARYAYILGQLYDELGYNDSAMVAYQKVIDLNRKIPRSFWIHAKINQLNSSTKPKLSITEAYEDLIKNDENKRFLDKIYFSKAVFHLELGDTLSTESLLNKSLRTNTQDNYLKGMAYETLADISFDKALFLDSGAYLDSTMKAIEPDTRKFRKVKRKRNKLQDIINYEMDIQSNDSILALMDKSPQEQKTFFTEYITEIKRLDSLQKVKEQQQMEANVSFFGNDFYFYDRTQLARGKSDFLRIWGDISLEDNWRFGKPKLALTPAERAIADSLSTEKVPEDPRYLVDTYLDQIPEEQSRDSLEQVRNTALFQSGLAYKEQFLVYDLAKERLTTLLSKPSDYTLPALYHLYQIAQETKDEQADAYKNRLLTEFPDSQYAQILLNPNQSLLGAFESDFEQAQQLFLEQNFEDVIDRASKAVLGTQDQDLRSRYALLRAEALGRLDGIDTYKTALNEVVLTYPKQTAGTEAKVRLDALAEIRKNQTNSDSYKLIFVRNRNENTQTQQLLQKCSEWIESQILENALSLTIDVYNREIELLVLHGFVDESSAADFAGYVQAQVPQLKLNKNFVVLTSQFRDALIFKDLALDSPKN